MPVLWIVHRDPTLRATLAHLARASEDTILGAPADPLFEAAPPPDVVLLGLAELEGDFEPELEFVHRAQRHLHDACWILLPEARHAARSEALFDTLDAEILIHPVDPQWLQASVSSALSRRGPRATSLSQRVARDHLQERFGRWFGDREVPGVMRALDPRLVEDPVLIQGEAGTGRSLLIRYLHDQVAGAGGPLIRMVCRADSTRETLLAPLRERQPAAARADSAVWLENVQDLSPGVQREVLGWIDTGLPDGVHQTRVSRWIATCGENSDPATPHAPLEPALRQALGALPIRLPPLRECQEAILPFARRTAQHWCAARNIPTPEFGPDACAALEDHAWPGNLRQLEAVVTHSLVAHAGGALNAADLRLAGEPFPSADPTRASALPTRALAPPPPDPCETVIDLGELIEAGAAHPIDPSVPGSQEPSSLASLADALAHEIRNPLSSIRTFTQLLPQRFDDPDFRDRFEELVGRDVDRILDVVERVDRLARWELDGRAPVDAAGLVDRIVGERREEIRRRRLEVLQELDRDHPLALGAEEPLRFALECLVDEGMGLVPDGSTLFVASHYHSTGLAGEPSLRILVRCSSAAAAPAGGEASPRGPAAATAARHSLSLALAQWVVRAGGGTFTLDTASPAGSVIVMDLPAP